MNAAARSVAVLVLAVAASSAQAASKPQQPGPPAQAAGQAIRGDRVLIEGKLYSPQALFIVTRRAETFARDAIVPHYLDVRPDAAFLPYRLRADRMAPAGAEADSSAQAPNGR